MDWFDNLSLRGKLILNFLVSGGVLVAAIVFCVLQIRSVGHAADEIARDWLPSVQAAAEISQLRLRYRVRSLEYMQPGSNAEKEKIERSLGELDGMLGEAFGKYGRQIVDAAERKVFDEAVKAAADYRAAVQAAIALAREGRMDEAQELRKTTWVKEANRLRDQTDALQKINRTGAERASVKAAAEVDAAVRGGIIALLAGIAIAFVSTFVMSERMSGRLGRAVQSANEIASGNLSGQLPPPKGDEIGRLIGAMSKMQQSLRTAMQETGSSAGAILEASQQLNGAVREMDRATGIQSAAASTIAANVEELTVSINVVVDNSSEAARLAADSDEQAGEGHRAIETLVGEIGKVADVVRDAADCMAQLKDDSEKISNIVSVIKDIADQTNLLALNAAIEAARAGEQGRGFAVVADEVRKLSERTALSTEEIARMVGAIQQSTGQVVGSVGHGVELADGSVAYARQAGDSIARLREMAQRVAGIISEVDIALREQSSASTEVAKKIEDIATQSEEASAVAHETSRAADAMSETAHRMQAIVARFRV